MKPLIMSVCGDPGGARAIIPVIRVLEKDQRVNLVHFAYTAAVDVMQQCGLVVNQLDVNAAAPADVEKILEKFSPNLILTTTSMHELAFEKNFIRQAQQRGIPSLSVLDFWSNYSMRFNDADGTLSYLPTKIAVMDAFCKAQMIREGFPDDRIVITGQPAFEQLEVKADSPESFDRQKILSGVGLHPDDLLVLFYSQPIRKYFSGTADYPGFDELTVLQDLIRILETIQPDLQVPVKLGIIPHPTQNAADFADFAAGDILVIPPSQASHELMCAADLILGMTTSRLVEALISHCPVLSLQPDCPAVFEFPQTSYGTIPVLTEREKIRKQIYSLLNNKTGSNTTPGTTGYEHIGATRRIEKLIYALLKTNKHELIKTGMKANKKKPDTSSLSGDSRKDE